MLPVALAGMVIGFVAMISQGGGAGVWFRPDTDFGPGSLILLWIAGGVLGLVAGLFEDATFTREYLLHRPVSAARLFWTRQLGCALVLASWIVITPALHLAAILLFHPNAPLVEPGRYWSMLNLGSVGVAFYAIGLFAVVVVRRVLLSIVIAFLLSLCLLAFFGASLYGQTRAALVVLPLLTPISFAIAALLLVASQRLGREPRDVDQPASRARLAAMAGALLVFGLAGSAFVHVLQLQVRRDITRRYPKMARLPDGTPLLVIRRDNTAPWRTDDRHRRIEGAAENAELAFEPRVTSPLRSQKKRFGERGRWIAGGVRYERAYCGVPAAGCFLGSDGRLHIYGYDRDEGPAPVHHLGKDSGAPFSASAQVVGWWGRLALIAEPQDGSLWRFDFARGGPGFEPAPLPDGDTFVEDLTDVVETAPSFLAMFAPHQTVIRGRRGVYVLEKNAFVPAPPEVQSAVATLDRRRRRPEAAVELQGPVRFRVTLPAAGGEPAFTHDYAPYTLGDRALSVQMHGLSLLRPPPLEVASLLFPRSRTVGAAGPIGNNPTDDDARILLDPLVMLGARWVLVINLLLGVGLALLTFRRLTKLGLPAGRRAFWSALVLLTGPAGFVVQRACEGARAWQAPEPATAKPPLIIASAA